MTVARGGPSDSNATAALAKLESVAMALGAEQANLTMENRTEEATITLGLTL